MKLKEIYDKYLEVMYDPYLKKETVLELLIAIQGLITSNEDRIETPETLIGLIVLQDIRVKLNDMIDRRDWL